jgi:hypothetical protein
VIKYTEARPTAACDTETYRDYWSIAFKDVSSDRKRLVEMYDGLPLDRQAIAKMLRNWRIVTFNGLNYDIPMISLAMSGATCEDLKRASDDIILSGLRSWQFYDKYQVKLPDFVDHIDLYEVAPGLVGLKMYGARLHSKRLQDLPFDPDHIITPADRPVMRTYVYNDVDTTIDLYHELEPQLTLRDELSERFGIDLRSKSDAQVAEALIKQKVEQRTGQKVYKPKIVPGAFQYVAPKYMQFETPYFQSILHRVLTAKFVVRQDGYVMLPPELDYNNGKGFAIRIEGATFAMGIGGLHSKESSISFYADDEFEIHDTDVRGYYPNMILASGKSPRAMGQHFQPVFRGIVDDREIAKAKAARLKKILAGWKGDKESNVIWRATNKDFKRAKSDAEGGKVQSNGSFGKTGSPYSVLYAPEMMIQTTIGGQLSIAMLIEKYTMNGIRVISANTDGVVTLVPKDKVALKWDLTLEWEQQTNLVTEETLYKSIHSRDVNNYVAITTHGEVKKKGVFTQSGPGQPAALGMKKNPEHQICADAVTEYLSKGTPIEDTIRECQDVRLFIVARAVKGGGYYDDERLGKVVRWYYGAGETRCITTNTGATVAGSRGAVPVMELPDELPDDIDYDFYEREAYAMLDDIGVPVDDPTLAGRTGMVLARREDQKTIHTVDMSTGVALCGMRRPSRRELWIEFKRVPDGHKHCSKCIKADEL